MLSSIVLFLNIGGSEMMLILLVALFLFGGKKLPELARGLGRGIREFKDASETIKKDINDQINNFGKDLDVSESASGSSYNQNASTKAPTEQVDDYSDGGNRQPEYYGSQSNYYGSSTNSESTSNSNDSSQDAAGPVNETPPEEKDQKTGL